MGKLSAGSSVHTRKPKLALISLNCSSPNFNTLLAGSHNLDLVLCSIVVWRPIHVCQFRTGWLDCQIYLYLTYANKSVRKGMGYTNKHVNLELNHNCFGINLVAGLCCQDVGSLWMKIWWDLNFWSGCFVRALFFIWLFSNKIIQAIVIVANFRNDSFRFVLD